MSANAGKSAEPGSILFFSHEPAQSFAAELAARGAVVHVAPNPTVLPPPDERGWRRAVSELALFNWLLLPTSAAAEALIEAIGAPPGPTLRVAAVGGAGDVLRAEGRAPEVEAAGLRAALGLMRVSRRQRTLVPHATVAGRLVGSWLDALGSEVVCRAAYDLDLASEALGPEAPVAAVLADSSEAETLGAYLGAGRLPATLAIAALGHGAADAAEDCGLSASFVPTEHFGPFLDEALS